MRVKHLRQWFVAAFLLLGISACRQNAAPSPQPSPQSYEPISGAVTVDGNKATVSGAKVGPTFFTEAKAIPMLGRSVINADLSGGTPVVVLSEKEWRDVFHADPTVIGKTIQVDDRPRTIVGIMPKSFDFPSGAAFWIPK